MKTTTRTTISEQGNISTGALDSDIAIEGSGMLLVSKTAKSFVYGGVAVSNLINPANAIYGARSAFNVSKIYSF